MYSPAFLWRAALGLAQISGFPRGVRMTEQQALGRAAGSGLCGSAARLQDPAGNSGRWLWGLGAAAQVHGAAPALYCV